MAYDETLYARYLEGKLTDEELKALEASGALKEIQGIISTVDSFTIQKLDKNHGFEQLLKGRKQKSLRNRYIVLFASAASILLFAGIFFNSNQQTLVQAQNGTIAEIELPDQSTIILNDGSSVQYNEKSWARKRKVHLNGEAVFDVKKGKLFTVQTETGNIDVLGTNFNVKAWDGALLVECYSGSVKVYTDSQSKILKKNESVKLINQQLVFMNNIDHERPLWSMGISRFYNESFMRVIEELERQYNIETLPFNDERPFSGFFNHDSLPQALDQICIPMGLSYKIKENSSIEFSK